MEDLKSANKILNLQGKQFQILWQGESGNLSNSRLKILASQIKTRS